MANKTPHTTTKVRALIRHFFPMKRWTLFFVVLAVIFCTEMGVLAIKYIFPGTSVTYGTAASHGSTVGPATPAPATSSGSQPSAPASSAPSTQSPVAAQSSSASSAQQIVQEAQQKAALYQVTCIDPMTRINTAFLNAQNTANTKAWADRNAIPYAPGTVQFRSAYNSVAYAFNFNVQLSYGTFISSIDSLNSTADCGVTPAYQKYSYWDMLDASGNYVPYVEGSSLYDY